jgi:PIN domain nuclease of toxin-antitoxin system
MNYILDACALLTFLNDEEGADKVEDLLNRGKAGEVSLFMSIVNLLEAYYGELRDKDAETAQVILDAVQEYAIEIKDKISVRVFHDAAYFKSGYRMSLADAIGLATAKELSGQFVTSDHSELEPVEQNEPIQFLWLPAKPKK